MSTEKSQLRHLSGEQAYKIYWAQFYHCETRISVVKAIDLNLDIIVDSNDKLLAYRHDPPEEMLGMTANNGLWEVFHEESIDANVITSLKEYIAKIRLGKHSN